MSLHRSVAPSLRAVHPALFLVGLGIVAVQVGLYLALAAVEAAVPAVYGTVITIAGPFVVLAVTSPLAVAVYVPVRERTSGTRDTLASAFRAIRRYYVRVFAAVLAALGGAVGLALGATAVTFVLATLVRYGHYALGDPAPPNAGLATWAYPIAFVGFLVPSVLVTRFADVFAAFADRRPRSAWYASVAFARREPASFVGYALLVAVLLGTAHVLPFAFASVDEPTVVVAAIGVVALVGTVGLVLASAIHVTYFERTVEPSVASVPERSVPWTRVAAVAVVLVAVVAGASYVRAADLGAGQNAVESLPDDSHAAYAVAANNTRDANHRRVVRSRNASDPGSEFRTVSRSAVDYDERRVSVFFEGNDDVEVGGFQGEGTIAMPSGGAGAQASALGPLVSERNGWTVIAAPGYGLVSPGEVAAVPRPVEERDVVERNETTIVYRVERPGAIERAIPQAYRGMQGGLADDSSLTLTVDRERAVVDVARFELRSRETGHAYEYVMDYSEVGTADVERPPEIGARSVLEWTWDVLYY